MAEALLLPASAVDWVILAIGMLSVLVGGIRGFLREALSLVIWVAALIMASLFADPVSGSLERWIDAERLRFPLAFAGLFLAVLLIGAMIQHLVRLLVDATGLTGLDRLLGVLFGIGRAIVLLVVAVAVLEPLLGSESYWQQSAYVPPLSALQEGVIDFLREAYVAVEARLQ